MKSIKTLWYNSKMTVRNQFTAVYKKTGNWFTAWVEEIPGVNTQGKTLKEARENLREALLLVLKVNRKSSRVYLKKDDRSRRESITIRMPA